MEEQSGRCPPDVVRRKSPPWCLTPWTYQVSRGTGSSINLLPRVECGTWRCRLTQPPSFSGFETFAAENAENDLFSEMSEFIRRVRRNLSAGFSCRCCGYEPRTSRCLRCIVVDSENHFEERILFCGLPPALSPYLDGCRRSPRCPSR